MMTVRDVVRPEGDDAPWTNDLEGGEDGEGARFVKQARQGHEVDGNGALPPELLREEIARGLDGLE